MLKRAKTMASAGLLALAASTLLLSPAALAADIYDGYGPRTSSPYDDPRYGDVYSHPAPPQRYAEPRYVDPPRYVEPRYEERHGYQDEPLPAPRNRYGYLEPMRPRHEYRPEPQQSTCLPHGEIRRSLINEGWRDFRDLELRGEVAVVQARRPNGQLYALKVDRCSGEIVHARPLDDGRVPYAYRGRYGGNTY